MSLNCRSPLSIESILSKMTNNIISNYSLQESKIYDNESDSINENSFLSLSKNSPKEEIEDDDDEDEEEEEKEIDESNMDLCKSEMETENDGCSIENKDTDDNNASIDGNYEIPEVNGIGQYCCHLCSFLCTIKEEFYVHLLTHYTYSCDQCDYASRTEGRLKRHIKDFHCANSPDNFSGQKVPSNNPKSLKCKHCGLISSSKEKHWNHQRTHLDVTKCLQCPKCPFITEYKHHLEYHIRNHEKIKPYKCSKCQYRCVNKSMLNSHKKSHSNVYQFRCADCSYASKYCHSLKQHLTRHSHQPAPVLNEDGSLPSYDNSSEILTMKRGPNNRTINIQTNISNSMENLSAFTPSTLIESTNKHDLSSAMSAFSLFKRDHLDSTFNLLMKQYYPSTFPRNIMPPFSLIPSFPNIMQLPLLPLLPRENLLTNFSCQNSALDLTMKPKQQQQQQQQQQIPNIPPNNESKECPYCRISFRDQNLFNNHFSFHSRSNPLLCNKCGTVSNNIIEFFKHLDEKSHQIN